MIIRLDCGMDADTKGTKNTLCISLEDLYNGYGEFNNLKLLSELFAELDKKGYKAGGLSLVMGYYDSVDDVTLRVRKGEK